MNDLGHVSTERPETTLPDTLYDSGSVQVEFSSPYNVYVQDSPKRTITLVVGEGDEFGVTNLYVDEALGLIEHLRAAIEVAKEGVNRMIGRDGTVWQTYGSDRSDIDLRDSPYLRKSSAHMTKNTSDLFESMFGPHKRDATELAADIARAENEVARKAK